MTGWDDSVRRDLQMAIATKRNMEGLADIQPSASNPNLDVFDAIRSVIADFENDIEPEDELGMLIANTPSPIHIDTIARKSSHLLLFTGSDLDGQKVVVLQHVSQLSFQLVALRKRQEQATRVGFHVTPLSSPDT